MFSQKKDLGRPASASAADQARRKDAASVENQEIAGAQQRGKVAKDVVRRRSGRAIEPEEERGVAVGKRVLRDPLRRKVVVEIVDFQNNFF